MSVTKYVNYCGLSVIGCCFRSRRGFIPGNINDVGEQRREKQQEENLVILDTSKMGNECVIVKNGRRICGTGAALANVEIFQDKCYFEVKIQSAGMWAIGLASLRCDLNMVPLGKDQYSWVLRSDGALMHNNIAIDNIQLTVSEGDYLSSKNIPPKRIQSVAIYTEPTAKEEVYSTSRPPGELDTSTPTPLPIVVDDGCIVDVNFDHFVFPPPPGFQKLMIEKDLL